ncbi:glycosyltransferase family 4 protein [Candidatus Uhrbacteria bacterium]|jgi:glycosyltransferase involved in cell wall biosynthesis|nr:glycosyltransferase family 4 protein [Candidatus Uhrbacteria bacterium]
MKIVMIGQKGLPSKFGGIETHVEHLSTRLVREGHEVIAYARPWYSPGTSDRFNGVRVIRIPSIRTKHLDAITHTLFSLIHACLISAPDVIHVHGVGPSLLSWIARILSPSSVVITTFHCIDREHGKWGAVARFALRAGEKMCVKSPHETICVSKVLRNYIESSYGKRTHYIPNGITPQRVTTNDVVLRPFGLRSNGYVAMVARLVPHKGAHILIDAWKVAKEKRPELLKDLKLAIVGGSSFTDSYIRDLHAQASGDDSIVFTDFQRGDVLTALFAGAKCIVHPSYSEGMPIAVLEAMSYGKAVLASDIPENLEVVEDHGVSFASGDVNDLASELIALLSDEMHMASIGHSARGFVETDYNWDDIAKETLGVYKKHIHQRHGAFVTE